jgi:hypothetical protein
MRPCQDSNLKPTRRKRDALFNPAKRKKEKPHISVRFSVTASGFKPETFPPKAGCFIQLSYRIKMKSPTFLWGFCDRVRIQT